MKEKDFVILKVSHLGKEACIFFVTNKDPQKLAKDLYTHISNHGSFTYESKMMGQRVYGDKKEFHEIFKSLGDLIWIRAYRVQFISCRILKLKCKVYPGIGLSIKDERRFLELFKGGN